MTLTLVGVIVWFIASRVLRLRAHQTGAVIVCALVANTAYLGYPLTVALLGHDHLSTGGALRRAGRRPGADARRVRGRGGVRRPGRREGPGERAKTFLTRNPPLYAAILGLLAPRALAPPALVDASQVLAICDPADRLLRRRRDAGRGRRARRASAAAAVHPAGGRWRSARAWPSLPALLMLLAAPLIDLPSAYRLMSAMPTGLNAMIVSHAYGLDNRTVAESITWSTAIVIAAALISLLF